MKRSLKVIMSITVIMAFIFTSLGLNTIAVKSIKLNVTSVNLNTGKTYALKVTITPDNATNKKLTFSSGNKKIAVVDKNGIIKGIIPGKTVITVASVSNKKAVARCNVTISRPKVVKLKFLTHEGNVNVKPSNNLLIYKELQKLTGVEIIWETVPITNILEVITTRFAAGVDLPDMCNMFGIKNSQGLQFFNDGIIIDLTDQVEKYGFGLKRFYSENEVARANGTFEGKILMYPEGDRFDNAYSVGLMLNKPWMDKLGLKAPESVDDLYEMLKTFKAADKDSLPLAGMWGMELYLRNPFGDEWSHTSEKYSYIVDSKGKVDAFVRTSGYKNYLTYMNKLFTEGLFEQTSKVGELATKEKNKLGAFCLFTAYGSMITNEVIDPTKQTVTFIPAKPLTGPGKPKAYNYKTLPVGKGGSFGFVVTKACKNPEAAVKWLDMVWFNEECLNLLYYGIEGKHHKVVNGKKVLIDQQQLYKDGGAETSIPARQFVELFDAGRPKFAEYDKTNMRPFHIPGSFPYPNLNIDQTESYGKYSQDVSTYFDEQTSKFIKGERSLNEFDAFVKQMNQLGLENMIKIQQEAYDKFKKKK